MKYLLVLILVASVSCNSSKKNNSGIAIIPKPESVLEGTGFCILDSNTTISVSSSSLSLIAGVFSEQVKDYISLSSSDQEEADIEMNIDSVKKSGSYTLEVGKRKILISAGTPESAFNALQSLRQLIIFSEKKDSKLLIPCCLINDSPRYAWRGIMLDESRHFFGVAKVKQLLDMMALHKLNVFHWHLTDCAGWRLEIKTYPDLTTIGGIGNHNDPDAAPLYYTQAEIRDIVSYAENRFIRIVPEIDMPGHAAASNRAYPAYSGGGSAEYPEFTFNPGLEGTYSYLTGILGEVTSLFPCQYIHLGGDEVNFGNEKWKTNIQVNNLMKKNKLPDLKSVEKYFVKRMADTIKSLNRKTVGWDEIVDLKIDPADAVIMWWRHDKPEQLDSALSKKYSVVLCPRIPLYFDFVQHTTHKWGRRWKGAYAELESVYNFPPDSLFRLPGFRDQVLGIQANLWTEVIQNDKRLDFMTYPRLSAMAEAAWTKNDTKDYPGFLDRLKPMLKFLGERSIYYFDPFDPELSPEPEGPQN